MVGWLGGDGGRCWGLGWGSGGEGGVRGEGEMVGRGGEEGEGRRRDGGERRGGGEKERWWGEEGRRGGRRVDVISRWVDIFT